MAQAILAERGDRAQPPSGRCAGPRQGPDLRARAVAASRPAGGRFASSARPFRSSRRPRRRLPARPATRHFWEPLSSPRAAPLPPKPVPPRAPPGARQRPPADRPRPGPARRAKEPKSLSPRSKRLHPPASGAPCRAPHTPSTAAGRKPRAIPGRYRQEPCHAATAERSRLGPDPARPKGGGRLASRPLADPRPRSTRDPPPPRRDRPALLALSVGKRRRQRHPATPAAPTAPSRPARRISQRAITAGVAVLLAVGCAVGLHLARGRPRPNVLLVTIDTLRADRVGCYGDARARRPTLDGLAAGGSVSPSPSPTLPSRARRTPRY